MLATAVFELVQLFYHVTEIDNVGCGLGGQHLRCSAIANKTKTNCFRQSELLRNTIYA